MLAEQTIKSYTLSRHSEGLTLLLGQKPKEYKTLAKEQQRFWKRILIVDDEADVTTTFKAVIEESNNDNDVNERIEVYTSNDPVVSRLLLSIVSARTHKLIT